MRIRIVLRFIDLPFSGGKLFEQQVDILIASGTFWVIRIKFKVGKQQWLSGGFRAAALGLDRDEDRVDLGNGLGVVELRHPAFLVGVILIKETQADGVLPVGTAATPGLKGTGLLDAWLLIQVVSIEDKRLVLSVEHAPKGLPGVADWPAS